MTSLLTLLGIFITGSILVGTELTAITMGMGVGLAGVVLVCR